jgi:hypothetical protein
MTKKVSKAVNKDEISHIDMLPRGRKFGKLFPAG